MKKIISKTLLFSILFSAMLAFTACKTDEEKCKEGDLGACGRYLKSTLTQGLKDAFKEGIKEGLKESIKESQQKSLEPTESDGVEESEE